MVILGFGPQGQMVANMLSSPLAAAGHQAYIAFDLEPSRVDASRQAGFLVQYGDGSRSDVLKAAGERHRGSLSGGGGAPACCQQAGGSRSNVLHAA